MKTKICLVLIALLSIGGIVVSTRLVKIHYENPLHVMILHSRFPITKKWIKVPMEEAPVDDPYKRILGEENRSAPARKDACEVGEKWSCHGVDDSKFSECFGLSFCRGVPTAGFGLMGYVGILIFAAGALLLRDGAGRCAAKFLSLFVFIAMGMSVWLTAIEHFVLKKYCLWCMYSAGISLVIFIALLVGVFGYAFGRTAAERSQSSRSGNSGDMTGI